jgi:hypothetical protein
MKVDGLVGATAVLVLVLLPATVNAQRAGGRHHDGHDGSKSVERSAGKQPATVQPAVVKDVAIGQPSVVRQPIVAGWELQAPTWRTGFGTMPVRTGFGTLPVRTGFETAAPVRTGFEPQTGLMPVPASIAGQQAFKSKRIHRHKQGTGVIVVGIPVLVPYPYAYLPQYGVTTSPAGPFFPPPLRQNAVQGAVGVSAGPSTYWMDLANETGAASGLTFNVSPASTQVYLNGSYVGTVQDFSTDGQPLLVMPGSHRLELRVRGYRTIALDVTLAAGQVVPYEGALEQLRPY